MSTLAAPRPLDPERLARHMDRLLSFARRLCGRDGDAEDLVQDTLERVLRRPRVVTGSETAYLAQALRNTHRSRLRAACSRVRTTSMPECLEPVDHLAEERPMSAQRAREVLDADRRRRPLRHGAARRQVADLAVAVADAWQRRGIGTQLAARVIARARVNGIACLTGSTLVDNVPARALLHRLGFRVRSASGGVMELELDLLATSIDARAARLRHADRARLAGHEAPDDRAG